MKDIFEILKIIIAGLIASAIGVLGGCCHESGHYNEALCGVLIVSLSVLLIVGTVISKTMKKKLIDGIDRENLQPELLKQRERAAEIAKEKIVIMKRLIKIIDFCSVIVFVSVSIITFCFLAMVGVDGVGILPMIIYGLYIGLHFVRPRKIKINENKSEDYLKESEYPLIYETAHQAAKIIGCEGKIKIFIDNDFNAGILTISDGYSIKLGSYLIDNMSREELFNVLLHEFAHVEKKNDEINAILNYAGLSQEDKTFGLEFSPYIYFHAKFVFEFVAYQYICSLMHEDEADDAMRKFGNPETAVSMLIKIKFFGLYEWERNTYDEENIFESETIMDDCVRRPHSWFRKRMEIRAAEWIKMIDSELLSRSSTHSTVKMRIQNLGVSEAKLIPKCDSEDYLAEVNKAFLHMEDIIKKGLKDSYVTIREENYLEPKRVIDQWEQDGKPITRENYEGILIALFRLLRITELVNLCCQVMAEIPEPANYFAHHMYGIYLLKCYDERGIEHLYKSIELNHNNWEEAMQTIGEYACIVGKQDELDKYRNRAMELAKNEIDIYEKMNSLKPKDKLVEENLPSGMLDDLVGFINGIDNGLIDKIYMVRKVISDEHFVTCIIIQSRKKADPKKYADMMNKIFQYLDKTTDWQFALFDMRSLIAVNPKKVKNSCIYVGKK